MSKTHRYTETAVLTLFVLISLSALCWGPPLPPTPPSSPIDNPIMCAITAAGMAVYGYWKMRK